jgi:hypothetical protein
LQCAPDHSLGLIGAGNLHAIMRRYGGAEFEGTYLGKRADMRIMSLVFSFVLTVLLATAVWAYVTEWVGQSRIVVQDGWISSSEPKGYQAYGQVASTEPDTVAFDRDTLAVR